MNSVSAAWSMALCHGGPSKLTLSPGEQASQNAPLSSGRLQQVGRLCLQMNRGGLGRGTWSCAQGHVDMRANSCRHSEGSSEGW